MKNFLLIALGIAVWLPKYNPLFDGMILRCPQGERCHWECEFGIVTSTTIIDDNLVVTPSGCASKTETKPFEIKVGQPFFYPPGDMDHKGVTW